MQLWRRTAGSVSVGRQSPSQTLHPANVQKWDDGV